MVILNLGFQSSDINGISSDVRAGGSISNKCRQNMGASQLHLLDKSLYFGASFLPTRLFCLDFGAFFLNLVTFI